MNKNENPPWSWKEDLWIAGSLALIVRRWEMLAYFPIAIALRKLRNKTRHTPLDAIWDFSFCLAVFLVFRLPELWIWMLTAPMRLLHTGRF